MRALAVHDDVVVFISRVWRTTCTAVRAGGEGFLIDSLVYPDELEALPAVLEQARFPVSGLLATHADWDHLLARLAFPDAPLGCAESTAARLQSEPGQAQRELRHFDEEHYVERVLALGLGSPQSLPVPGRLSIGAERELELHPTPGHTPDGMAVAIPWAGVLVCGDYLSPAEIPMIDGGEGAIDAYLATLERLQLLIERNEIVVPGHGAPLQPGDARRLLAEDLSYLTALQRVGASAPLPPGRRTAEQKRIHAHNAERVAR
jgi:glyoxylase-like metal-dependent hydrolase (beta-lactamase superfamily II)